MYNDTAVTQHTLKHIHTINIYKYFGQEKYKGRKKIFLIFIVLLQ